MMEPIKLVRETTTRDFLAIVFRRKFVIIAVVALASILTMGRSIRAPVIYWSKTQVLLQRGQRTSSLETRVVLRPWEEVVNSELNIAISQPVVIRAKEILARQRSTPEREIFAGEINIQTGRLEAVPEGVSSVINIRYGALNPQDAREVVDAVTEAYLEIHRELFRLPDARQVIEGHLDDTEQRLNQLAQEKREFMEEHDVVSVEEEQIRMIAALEETESELLTLRSDIAGKERQIEGMETALEAGDPERVPLTGGTVTPGRAALVRMREDLVRLRTERRDLLARYHEGHGEVRSVTESIDALMEELVRGMEGELREQEAELEVLQAQEKTLVKGRDALRARLARMPEVERRIDEYDRRIRALEDYYRDFQRGEFSLTVSEVTGRDFEAVLLSSSNRPEAENPRDLVRLALGPGLGLLAGLGLALFLERFDHSVHSPEDVEDFLGLPVLASVSEAPWRPKKSLGRILERYRP